MTEPIIPSTITWDYTFPEPCAISSITLYNRTHNKLKYWTYTCDLTNGYTIKWSMAAAQQCCESYSTFIGKTPDRDTVQCTEYDVSIQEMRANVLANIGRSHPNLNYPDLRFTKFSIYSSMEHIANTNSCGKRPNTISMARLSFGNARLDHLQLGMQCSGQYAHDTLLELISPIGELVCEKTFILC